MPQYVNKKRRKKRRLKPAAVAVMAIALLLVAAIIATVIVLTVPEETVQTGNETSDILNSDTISNTTSNTQSAVTSTPSSSTVTSDSPSSQAPASSSKPVSSTTSSQASQSVDPSPLGGNYLNVGTSYICEVVTGKAKPLPPLLKTILANQQIHHFPSALSIIVREHLQTMVLALLQVSIKFLQLFVVDLKYLPNLFILSVQRFIALLNTASYPTQITLPFFRAELPVIKDTAL